MSRSSNPRRPQSLRAVLTATLASMTLLGSNAWAQKEPPPDEEPRYEEAVLEEGKGWQLKEIRGTALDDATNTYQDYSEFVYTLQPIGIREVPMPADISEALQADAANSKDDTVYTLNQTILQEIEISREKGYLTLALEKLAERPDEGVLLNGGYSKLSGCPDRDPHALQDADAQHADQHVQQPGRRLLRLAVGHGQPVWQRHGHRGVRHQAHQGALGLRALCRAVQLRPGLRQRAGGLRRPADR